jgi:NAD(P)-dependent dehydrogenase (short-subunit alcohol dehydrogenase family)
VALPSLFDFTGQVALVTGGSRGSDAGIAEGLEEARASLMLLARRDQRLADAVERPMAARRLSNPVK